MFDDLNEGERTPGDGELGPKPSPEPVAGSPGEPGDSKALPKAGLKIDKRLKRPLSKRTGGPSSPGGKAIASKNSLTHGAYASVPPESVEFLGYLDKAQQELRPSGLVEGELAASIAFLAFKAQRIRGNEMGQMIRSASRGLDTEQLAKRVGFPWRVTHHELLAEPVNEALLQRLVNDGWRRLAVPPTSGMAGDVVSVQDIRVATIFDEACRVLSIKGMVQLAYEDFFMRLDAVMMEARSGASYLGQRVSSAGDELFLVHYWLYRNSARVNACAQDLSDDMLLDVYADERLMRANAYVSTRMRNDIETLQTVKDIKGRWDADYQSGINRKGR
jgi:hypothetical protein